MTVTDLESADNFLSKQYKHLLIEYVHVCLFYISIHPKKVKKKERITKKIFKKKNGYLKQSCISYGYLHSDVVCASLELNASFCVIYVILVLFAQFLCCMRHSGVKYIILVFKYIILVVYVSFKCYSYLYLFIFIVIHFYIYSYSF